MGVNLPTHKQRVYIQVIGYLRKWAVAALLIVLIGAATCFTVASAFVTLMFVSDIGDLPLVIVPFAIEVWFVVWLISRLIVWVRVRTE